MNIAFVGLSGVPYLKRASDTRLISFAEAFVRNKNSVSIYNRAPSSKKKEGSQISMFGNEIKIFEVINHPKSSNKLVVLLVNILSYPIEFYRLIKENKKSKIHVLHIYSGHFFEYIHYYLLAKIIRAKTVYQYVEFRSAIERRNLYHKINGYLCDKIGIFMFDGIICISNYLENHVKKLTSMTPTIKIPPICDFKFFDSVKKEQPHERYILYCGSADYMEVIKIIIDAYEHSACPAHNIHLVLVISGSINNRENLKKLITSNKYIQLKSNLEYIDLIKQFKMAEALLIPLRNTIQDIARFPNKICEYTASENVIITTHLGEIPYFFRDKENALIAHEFSQALLTEKINWLVNNKPEAIKIRKNAFELGKENFNIENYLSKLEDFINSL